MRIRYVILVSIGDIFLLCGLYFLIPLAYPEWDGKVLSDDGLRLLALLFFMLSLSYKMILRISPTEAAWPIFSVIAIYWLLGLGLDSYWLSRLTLYIILPIIAGCGIIAGASFRKNRAINCRDRSNQ